MLSVVQMQWEAQRADSTDGAGESLRAPGPRLILQGKEWVRRTADNAAPLWQGSPGSQDVPCKVGKGSTFRGTQRVSQKQSSPEGESLREHRWEHVGLSAASSKQKLRRAITACQSLRGSHTNY